MAALEERQLRPGPGCHPKETEKRRHRGTDCVHPAPGSFDHPLRNGHRPGPLIEELHPHHVQDRELVAELEALLADEAAVASSVRSEQSERSEAALLPGFEALTWDHLAEARRVGDQLDDRLDESAELTGVRHGILLANGGASFGDHDPNASLAVQLEHDPHQRSVRRVVLELRIGDIPHEAFLDLAEAAALRRAIARLLNDAGH